MYRSEDLHFATDRGMPIQNARCEAFRMDTKASVEEAFTDEYGDVAFTLLPAAIDCIIFCYHHGTSSFYYSKKDPPLGDLDGDLDDIDDGTTYGRLNVSDLTANRVDFDKLSDGTTYKRVLGTHLDASGIKISSLTTFDTANYNPSLKRQVFTTTPTTPYYVGDLWFDADNIRRCITQRVTGSYTSDDWIQTTLDAIKDGTTYERVKSTSIYAGNIKLTSNTVADGKWYNESGVVIDADAGVAIYGVDKAFATYKNATDYGTGTYQSKVDSNGKIVAGAGTVLLDSSGITIKGKTLILQDPDGTNRGYVAGYNTGGTTRLYVEATHDLYLVTGASSNLYISAANIKDCPSIEPGGGALCGKTAAYWTDMTTVVLTLSETTTPTAVTNFGKLYTKDSNKLFFQSGDGVEHEIAYV